MSGEKNASTLATGFRFDDEGLRLACLAIVVIPLKFSVVVGEHPGIGEELEFLRKSISEAHQALTKIVLAGEDIHTWKVVYSLVLVHLVEGFLLHVAIRPAQVEVHVREGFCDLRPL